MRNPTSGLGKAGVDEVENSDGDDVRLIKYYSYINHSIF